MMFSKKLFLLLLYPLAMAAHCHKNSSPAATPADAEAMKDSVIVSGLNYPWEILWGPDNHIWMTERNGRISRVNPANGTVIPLLTIQDVESQNEGGLLGMVLHPSFNTNPYVYVVYNYESGMNYEEKLVRYTYNGSTLTSPAILMDHIKASSIHNGSRLLIGSDQKLYMSTGDASNQALPQNINSVNGKILRLNLDGTIPADNPVPGNPYWSSGLRNVQGMVFVNNRLWASDHGPTTDDELNIIEKGRNYGWPEVKGPCNTNSERNFCDANRVVEPVKAWSPTLAVCGMDYYNSNTIPQWKNSLLMVALKNARLYQMKLDANGTGITSTNEYFTNEYGRLRDVCVAPNGKVYICTSNGGGRDVIFEVR